MIIKKSAFVRHSPTGEGLLVIVNIYCHPGAATSTLPAQLRGYMSGVHLSLSESEGISPSFACAHTRMRPPDLPYFIAFPPVAKVRIWRFLSVVRFTNLERAHPGNLGS